MIPPIENRSVRLLDLEGVEALAAEMAVGATKGFRLYLTGDLGTGKSVFARAFLRGLGVTGHIPSPSYIVDAVYSIGDSVVHHMDLYRLDGKPVELEMLGLEEVFTSDCIVVVEWADRLQDAEQLPGYHVFIEMTDDPDIRKVRIDERSLAGN